MAGTDHTQNSPAPAPRRPSLRSRAEELLYRDLAVEGCAPEIGHDFHPTRRWKFDLAWPAIKLAVEIDGRGRHQTHAGKDADDQKINAAIELGWRVLRYPATRVTTDKRRERIVEQIRRVIYGVACAESAACVLVGE